MNAARPKDSLAVYLELHIEQGKRLERAGINIGVVSAIVGIWSYRISFIGRADHAGSTTMDDRLDASLGASAFTLAARGIVLKDFPNCVVNVGKMEFTPGAFNIIPAPHCSNCHFESLTVSAQIIFSFLVIFPTSRLEDFQSLSSGSYSHPRLRSGDTFHGNMVPTCGQLPRFSPSPYDTPPSTHGLLL